MIRITTSLEVEAPAATVYSYISDFTNNPEWQSGVESTKWTSPPPLREGSTYNQKVEYKGLMTSYTVTAIDPGRSVTTKLQTASTIPNTVTRTVRPLSETRCEVDVDLVAEPQGWRRFFKPLLARAVRKSVKADYRRLKSLLETGSE